MAVLFFVELFFTDGIAVAAMWCALFFGNTFSWAYVSSLYPNAMFPIALASCCLFSALGSFFHCRLQKRRLELKTYRGKYPKEALPSKDYYTNKGMKRFAWGFVVLASAIWNNLPSNPIAIFDLVGHIRLQSYYGAPNIFVERMDVIIASVVLFAFGLIVDKIIGEERARIKDTVRSFKENTERKEEEAK